MSSLWQYPYVNLFKHFGVGQWKKCSREGDVTATMDRDIKATVYRVSGSIPAGNFIQLPKSSSQSLGLTGRYLYLVFRPLPSKYFVVHVEVTTVSGLVVRISFSNLFKEFKSTSTWLQFPFVTGSDKENTGSTNVPRWTLLALDLRAVLSKYIHAKYANLKNIKLCSSLLVKNVFTSDIEFSPLVDSGKDKETHVHALPREMAFPVARGREFSDYYEHIKFPLEVDEIKGGSPLHGTLKGRPSGVVCVDAEGGKRDGMGREAFSETDQKLARKLRRSQLSASTSQPKKHSSKSAGNIALAGSGDPVMSVCGGGEEGEVHVYAKRGAEVTVHREGGGGAHTKHRSKLSEMAPKRSIILQSSRPRKPAFQSLEPDPILKLQRVVGFGGYTTGQLLFGAEETSLLYPCHSLVVDLEVSSGRQRFFIGHTDKVSCLSLNHAGTLLASGQTGPVAVVRIWKFETTQCLALFKTHNQGLHTLSFSHSGGVLCGVGRDGHGKNLVVLWNTSLVATQGEVSVLAKAHTEASIEKMRIAAFDDSRMVSCGWDNVRFWRVRGGSLRSCPVNLVEHHQTHFTDVMFQPGYHNDTDLTDRNVYACTKNGHLFEFHYKRIAVKRVWHLLPGDGGGVAINALYMHEAFCVTGSEDGVLRLWPLDFSTVFLEAEHEGAVTAVGVSEDGLKVLAGTSSGNVGLLDAGSRSYTTLVRSHAGTVQSMALCPSRGRQLVTCSTDHTIRVWDIKAGTQLFDFRSPGEGTSCVCCHPCKEVFACGFQSGAVRVFHTPSTSLLAEHKQHRGVVTGLVFSPAGHRLYSSSSSGSLAMYDSEQQSCRLMRLLGNTVARGEHLGPRALCLSEDGGRLVFIGPLEFTVTVLDADTLDEVLRLAMDITPMAPSPSHSVDPARLVCLPPRALDQLVVVTSGARLLKFNASTGQLLSEVSHIHRGECTALSVSRDGRYLLTAGDKVVKVWDYNMALDLNFQVFIGHSEPITHVEFSLDNRRVISCGDAIFIWDFMARQGCKTLPSSPPSTSPPSTPPPSTPPPSSQHPPTSFTSASPRKRAPTPTDYEPLKMHSFTPLAPTPRQKDKEGQMNSRDLPPLNVDDDCLYQPHSDSKESDEDEKGPAQANINRFKHRLRGSGSASDGGSIGSESPADGEEREEEREGIGSSNEDIIIEHGADQDLEVTIGPQRADRASSQPLQQDTPSPSGLPTALKHYCHAPPRAATAQHLYVAPPEQAGVRRRTVLGLSGAARNNVIWQPASGLFAFSSGSIVVVEDLSNGQQRHLTGHLEEVSTLAAQHDSRVLASASPAFDSTPCEIRIWRLASGKCSKILTFHHHAVMCMAYSRDDRLLLSAGTYQENTLALWSSRDYSLLAASTLSHAIHEVRWDPCTAYEFTAVGAQASISFWVAEEMDGGNYQLKLHEPTVPTDLLHTRTEFTSVCYGPESALFVGTNTGLISLWDTRENQCVMYWKTEPREITTMLSTGGRLLTGNSSGCLQLWSVDHSSSPPAVTMETSLEVDRGVFCAAFDNKMELGVVGTSAGTVWYINWSEKSSVKLVCGHAREVCGVALSEGGNFLASCGREGALSVLSVATMEQIVLLQAPKKECTCSAFSPVHPLPAITSTNEQGPPPSTPPPPPHLVAGYSDGTLRVFDMEKVQMVRKMQPHAAPIRAVAYSANGHVILSGCSNGVVTISNPSTGLVVRVITDHQGAPITDMHTSNRPVRLPGSEDCYHWLVASGDRRVSVWSADWGRDVCQLVDWLTFPGPSSAPDGTKLRRGHKCQYELLPPSLARFSPTDPDTILYTGYGMERCVQFYSLSQKTVVRTSALTHWATCMDVSPQGHLLAFGCQERVMKIMDYDEGSFQDYTGHHDSITNVLFSPCGKFLVSTSSSAIHVWDVVVQ